jgi:PAS domain S-box-containing protein
MAETLSSPMILLVEDDPGHVELIQRSLDDHGHFKVKVAASLAQAREALSLFYPDLILSDYRLPDGEGTDVLSLVAGQVPVVMMTSHGNEWVAVEVMKAGVIDYVVKSPENFEALPRILERALRESELIRERNLAETALRESEQRYRAIFEQAGDGIMFLSLEGEILSINDAFARLHGYSVAEIKAMGLAGIDANLRQDEHLDRLRRIMAGEKITFEVEHFHRDGHIVPLEVVASLITIGREQSVISFHRDISDRRDAEIARLNNERQSQQSQRLESLGLLAGGIAHDFNNLLMVILGHVELLRNAKSSGTISGDDLDKIERAGKSAAELCRQMLSYAGKGHAMVERIDLEALIRELTSLLGSSISKKAELVMQLQAHSPMIMADPSQIRQVIMNLIINASEAIGKDSGRITVATAIVQVLAESPRYSSCFGKQLPVGTYVCVSVADNGCGMDEATMQKIFDPFFTTKVTGRGLGMSAMLGIVNAHHGYIQMTSEPGMGSKFAIYFPIIASKVETAPIVSGRERFVNKNLTVLLVDDEEMVRDVGASLLEALEIAVLTACDGYEALERYDQYHDVIDLVILDMAMPRMDGVETFRELRRRYPDVRIIMASGYTGDEVAGDLLGDGLLGFLQKPYTFETLRQTLAAIQ